MAASAHHRLPMLDALRGYAVIGVILTHALYPLVHVAGAPLQWGPLSLSPFMLVRSGTYAVQLFFLISGFVLCLPYATGRRQMAGVGDALRYLKRRALRILPLFWLAFLVPMFLYYGAQPWDDRMHQLVPLFTMTFPFVNDVFLPQYNFPLWSLGVEIWLSLLLPLIIVWVCKAGVRVPLLSLVLVSVVTKLAAALLAHVFHGYFLMCTVPSQLDAFMFGIVLAYLHANKQSASRPAALSATGAAIVFAGCVLNESVVLNSLPFAAMGLSMLATNCGLALLTHGLLSMRRNPVRDAIANPLLCQLGRMCYSFYVWHVPVLSAIGVETLVGSPDQWLVFIAALTAVATVSYRYIEFGQLPMHVRCSAFCRNAKRRFPGREAALQ